MVELYWKVTIGYNPRYSADFFLLKELIQNADDARDGRWRRLALRVISDCHFSVQLNHFIPVFLSYSVAVFQK